MKGIGLIMIMLHNYFHIIPPISGQNEFTFHEDAFYNFLRVIATNPFDFIRQVFSYLGHYGVTIFVFVSSYGLYSSYKEKRISYAGFLKKRILKLYPTLLIVVLLLFIFISIYRGAFPEAGITKSLLLKLTLLSNFIPGEALEVDGPLWFFSMIVQLYAVFPLLKFIVKKYGENSMLIVAFLMVITSLLLNTFLVKNDLSAYFLFIGQMPVFCLGIYFAAHPVIKIRNEILILAVAIFLFANANLYAWHFSFLAFAIIILSIFILVQSYVKLSTKIRSFLAYTGGISLSLFAVHGMMRFPFEALAEKYNEPLITSMLAVPFIICAYAGAWFIRLVEKNSTKYF